MSGQPAAIVTGAARGIGRAIALGLAASGFDIAAIDLEAPGETAASAKELQILQISRAMRRSLTASKASW
jgi:NAD(P)-dependent dehydrogenase (short-subunit alcohol dehydrogenase family)